GFPPQPPSRAFLDTPCELITVEKRCCWSRPKVSTDKPITAHASTPAPAQHAEGVPGLLRHILEGRRGDTWRACRSVALAALGLPLFAVAWGWRRRSTSGSWTGSAASC
ncbi:MAG: hypothetical protein LM590_10280, partial [Thermofilum sp.]|nr:hypothetical protein [Thermofilum sp.]